MTIDLAHLTRTVEELASQLESDFQEREVEVGDLVLIVEVKIGDDQRQLRVRAREGMSAHARVGLLSEAENVGTLGQVRRWMEAQRSLRRSEAAENE